MSVINYRHALLGLKPDETYVSFITEAEVCLLYLTLDPEAGASVPSLPGTFVDP